MDGVLDMEILTMPVIEGVNHRQRGGVGPAVSIPLSLPAPMHARLAERAKAQGYKPTQYAQLLLEAAYAARVEQDCGDEPADAALGRCVRLVFMLSECEPEFIAETLGLSRELVDRVISGWKAAGRSLTAELASTATPRNDSATRQRMTEAEKDEIARMWCAGASARAIAKAVNRPVGSIQMWISNNRDRCPKRRR